MLMASICVVCGDGREAVELCRSCIARLRPAPDLPPLTVPGVGSAAPLPVHALLEYDDRSRAIVLGLKNHNVRRLARRLGPSLAALVDGRDVDAVTWAPTTAARRRERGYDHAELLARAVGASLDRPVFGLLRRVPGPSQHGRDGVGRREGPTFALVRRVQTGGEGRRVLLVDDVVTTGATLTAAARALAPLGGTVVAALVVARSPGGGLLKAGAPGAETVGCSQADT